MQLDNICHSSAYFWGYYKTEYNTKIMYPAQHIGQGHLMLALIEMSRELQNSAK